MVSGSKKSPKRQSKGAVPMEIDSISKGPKRSRCVGTALPGPALTELEAPSGILRNRRKEVEVKIEAPGAQNPLSGTPFSFLFRGFVGDVSMLGSSGTPVFRDEVLKFERIPWETRLSLGKSMTLKLLSMTVRISFRKVVWILSFSLKGPKLLGNFGLE